MRQKRIVLAAIHLMKLTPSYTLEGVASGSVNAVSVTTNDNDAGITEESEDS
jgi:hypothetical protein